MEISQEWTIQRNWQHWAHKTQYENEQNITQKTKKMSNTDPIKNTTQKTKKMSNTDPQFFNMKVEKCQRQMI
jgi:hypothetical protein